MGKGAGKGAQNAAMMAFKFAPARDDSVSAPSLSKVAGDGGADPADAHNAHAQKTDSRGRTPTWRRRPRHKTGPRGRRRPPARAGHTPRRGAASRLHNVTHPPPSTLPTAPRDRGVFYLSYRRIT